MLQRKHLNKKRKKLMLQRKHLNKKRKVKMFIAQVFTLYPDCFPGPLDKGLYGKAMEKNMGFKNCRY